MTAASARRPAPHTSASEGVLSAIARLDERQRSHEELDDSRIGGVMGSLNEVKQDVRGLADKVTAIGEDVGEIKGKIAGLTPAGIRSTGPPVRPSKWHIGASALTLLLTAAAIAASIMGWLATELYDAQPARMRVAQSPTSVQIVQPPR